MKKSIFTIGTLALMVSFQQQIKAQVCFSPATNYTAGSQPYSVTSGDFNNDGFKDLAVANNSYDVSVFLGAGTGTFGTATNFTTGGSNFMPNSIISADFNGDGKLDLATANSFGSGGVSILIGTGTGSFGAANNFAVGSMPYSVTSADFNGDGKLDLATANNSSNNVSVLIGTGTGSFNTATNYTVGANPTSVISADFNGDGKKDLAVANSLGISILLGTGTGSFGIPNNFGAGGANSIISADFNGDGKLDLATDNVSILLGDGTGSFGTAANFAVSGSDPYSVISADFNGDGKLDLATANALSNNVSVLLGTGTGSFGTAFNFAVATEPYSVTSADFNGDSKPDLATVSYTSSNNVSVLLNAVPPTVTVNSATACAGSTATITTSGTATTYSWNIGATTSSITPSPTVTTDYTVIGTDGNGCINTATSTVTVNALPIVSANSTTNNYCTGSSGIVLTGGGATTYTWAGGVIDGVAFTPTASNTYTVTGTDGNGCTNKATKLITVSNPPTVYANATTTSLCRGDSVTLTGSGALTYTWTNSVIDGVAFTPTSSNTYYVNGTDVNGCTNTTAASVGVIVNLPPTVGIAATATVVCAGTSVTLTQSGNAVSYSWSGGVVNGVAFVPTTTTTYSLTGTGINGCTKTVTKLITVNALSTINAVSDSTSLCVGNTATLTASGATSYTWSNSATTASISITPTVTTTYSVLGTDVNGCTNMTTVTQTVITCSTDIQQVISSNEVSIYPNPNNGSFIIETNSTTKQTVNVYDANSKLVLSQIINGKTTIDSSTLNEGVYNISLSSKEGVVNKRLVIVR